VNPRDEQAARGGEGGEEGGARGGELAVGGGLGHAERLLGAGRREAEEGGAGGDGGGGTGELLVAVSGVGAVACSTRPLVPHLRLRGELADGPVPVGSAAGRRSVSSDRPRAADRHRRGSARQKPHRKHSTRAPRIRPPCSGEDEGEGEPSTVRPRRVRPSGAITVARLVAASPHVSAGSTLHATRRRTRADAKLSPSGEREEGSDTSSGCLRRARPPGCRGRAPRRGPPPPTWLTPAVRLRVAVRHDCRDPVFYMCLPNIYLFT
jgi:hypothetical protein